MTKNQVWKKTAEQGRWPTKHQLLLKLHKLWGSKGAAEVDQTKQITFRKCAMNLPTSPHYSPGISVGPWAKLYCDNPAPQHLEYLTVVEQTYRKLNLNCQDAEEHRADINAVLRHSNPLNLFKAEEKVLRQFKRGKIG